MPFTPKESSGRGFIPKETEEQETAQPQTELKDYSKEGLQLPDDDFWKGLAEGTYYLGSMPFQMLAGGLGESFGLATGEDSGVGYERSSKAIADLPHALGADRTKFGQQFKDTVDEAWMGLKNIAGSGLASTVRSSEVDPMTGETLQAVTKPGEMDKAEAAARTIGEASPDVAGALAVGRGAISASRKGFIPKEAEMEKPKIEPTMDEPAMMEMVIDGKTYRIPETEVKVTPEPTLKTTPDITGRQEPALGARPRQNLANQEPGLGNTDLIAEGLAREQELGRPKPAPRELAPIPYEPTPFTLETPEKASVRVAEINKKTEGLTFDVKSALEKVTEDIVLKGLGTRINNQVTKINERLGEINNEMASGVFVKNKELQRTKKTLDQTSKRVEEIAKEQTKLKALSEQFYTRLENKHPDYFYPDKIDKDLIESMRTFNPFEPFDRFGIPLGERLKEAMREMKKPSEEFANLPGNEGAITKIARGYEAFKRGPKTPSPQVFRERVTRESRIANEGWFEKMQEAEIQRKKDEEGFLKVMKDKKMYSAQPPDPKELLGKSFYTTRKKPTEQPEQKEPKKGSATSSILNNISTEKTIDKVKEVLKEAENTPTFRDLARAFMPLASGPAEAAGIMKSFANVLAAADYAKARLLGMLNKFNKNENKLIYLAREADHQATLSGEPVRNGVETLPKKLKDVAETIQNDYIDALQKAQEGGVIAGGYEFYTPRKLIATLSDGTVKSIADMLRKDSINGVFGPKRTMGALKQRKYKTVEETEKAAQEAFGENVTVAKDIRVLPMVTAELRKVTATKALIEEIKRYGNENFIEYVSDSPQRGWMTLNHPAFKHTWIHPDFYPNIQSILNPGKSNIVTRALMNIKSASTGVLLFNPFIHGTVIYAKAVPYDRFAVASGLAYMKGGALRGSPLPEWMYKAYGLKRVNPEEGWAYQKAAMEEGGFRPPSVAGSGARTDITGMYGEPQIGNSWTAQLVGKAAKVFNKEIEAKMGVDKLGEFWHGSLLWNRITDLGMYIYDKAWKDLVKQGMTPEAAKPIAGHIANRYMGTVPSEAMSTGLRTALNLTLFSRPFNVTNLGIYKDVLLGLPNEIRGQIEKAGSEAQAAIGDKYLKKAQTISLAFDVIVTSAIASAIMQNIIAAYKKYPNFWDGLGEEGKEYAVRLGDWFERMGNNPMAFLEPDISPLSKNEPGKEDRVYLGNDIDGTGMYLKNPFGKVGEDLIHLFNKPVALLQAKQSQFLKLIGGSTYSGGLLYNSEKVWGPEGALSIPEKAGNLLKLIADSFLPFGSVDTFSEILKDNPKGIHKLKAASVLTPASISKGYPGGPEAGVIASEERKAQYKFGQDRKLINNALDRDDIDGAYAIMQKHNKSEQEILNYIFNYYEWKPEVGKILELYKKGSEEAITDYENVNSY